MHGDRQTELAELYQRYGHLVLRRCRFLVGNDAEAQDLLQEVFVRALRYWHSLAAADSKLAWMYRCAENCCFDYLRKNRKEALGWADALAELVVYEPHGATEARQLMGQFFAQLDAKMQQLAVMHFVDELSQEEMAQHLGWSRKTVGKKLRVLQQRGEKLAASHSGVEVKA